MTDEPSYVLDTNVFIEAARHYYAFDLAWNSLVEHAQNGRLVSIDRVKQELDRGRDRLAEWADDSFSDWFASTDEDEVVNSYGEIMRWVQAQDQFFDGAKADFADGADGWLMAYAKVKGCTVVTHEALNPDIKRKVPIPNVCQGFEVPFVNTFEMLRSLGIQFV